MKIFAKTLTAASIATATFAGAPAAAQVNGIAISSPEAVFPVSYTHLTLPTNREV